MPVGFIDGELRPESRLPTGRVALLLADVENSTGHLTDLGDRYQRLLADVRRLLRTATRRASGREVDARGDEFFAAFSEPARALEAAIAIQRAFATHAWTDGRRVRVRIGLHVGRPTLTATGYVGIAVNTVARLSAMGHGSQILASWSLRDAVGDTDGIALARPGAPSAARHPRRARALPGGGEGPGERLPAAAGATLIAPPIVGGAIRSPSSRRGLLPVVAEMAVR